MKVTLISKAETNTTGLSRYVDSLVAGLHASGQVEIALVQPSPLRLPGFARRLTRAAGMDLTAFFDSYPLHCPLDHSQLYHLTNQNLATLLLFQRIQPAVITVHDIIPHLVRSKPELDPGRNPAEKLFYTLALKGLHRAQAIIAISHYTRQTLIEEINCRPEKVHVVYRAVDTEVFKPLPVPETFRQEYALDQGLQYILYVGSEDPRKNLATLIEAFAQVLHEFPTRAWSRPERRTSAPSARSCSNRWNDCACRTR